MSGYWYCNKCGTPEPASNGYEIGDSEPCCLCLHGIARVVTLQSIVAIQAMRIIESKSVDIIIDGCEWNPSMNRAAFDTDEHHRTTPAEIIVGAEGKWRLCAECAALPRFARYRKRVPVRKVTQERIATMNDIELKRKLKALNDEKEPLVKELNRRENAIAKAKEEKRKTGLDAFYEMCVSDSAIVDFLVGDHKPGRYGSTCSDQDLSRGREFDRGEFGKDWKCERCILLEAIRDRDPELKILIDFGEYLR